MNYIKIKYNRLLERSISIPYTEVDGYIVTRMSKEFFDDFIKIGQDNGINISLEK